jgi:hypothetical protein
LREIRARLCRVSPREEALPRTCRQIPTSWKLFLCRTPLHFVVQRFLVLHTILNRMTSSNMAHEYSLARNVGAKTRLGGRASVPQVLPDYTLHPNTSPSIAAFASSTVSCRAHTLQPNDVVNHTITIRHGHKNTLKLKRRRPATVRPRHERTPTGVQNRLYKRISGHPQIAGAHPPNVPNNPSARAHRDDQLRVSLSRGLQQRPTLTGQKRPQLLLT